MEPSKATSADVTLCLPSINASVCYLERLALYETEKPYMTIFDPSDLGGKMTNHKFKPKDVVIYDAQPERRTFELDIHGFEFHRWHTELHSEDFDDEQKVLNVYYPEMRQKLVDILPKPVEVLLLTHLRRKRRPDFPRPPNEEFKFKNPVVFAHTDFTPYGAAVAVERQIRDRPDLQNLRYEILNMWRVTKGPNRDWPLALCDYNTLVEQDYEESDIIHRDYVGESARFYCNDAHRWYFLDHQDVDDVVVFRNTDSRGTSIPFAPHTAFDYQADNSKSALRESVELRVVCFY